MRFQIFINSTNQATVISQLNVYTYTGGFNTVSQQFIAPVSGTLAKAILWLNHDTPGTVTVQIKNGSTPSTGTVIASENITVTNTFQKFEVLFSSPPELTGGSIYLLHVTDNGLASVLHWESCNVNPYTSGVSFWDDTQVNDFDMKFEVFIITELAQWVDLN
jgi:hypothetical protein